MSERERLCAEVVTRARQWERGRPKIVAHEYLESCACPGCKLVSAVRALEATELVGEVTGE